jgi:hypothetical protein
VEEVLGGWKMAEQLDWAILGRDASVKTVTPDKRVSAYDLYNLTTSEALVYGSRPGNNINLRWGDAGKSDNIRFVAKSGERDPIKFEELFAIYVRNGGFLVYQRGRQGINLGWSKTPKSEWRFKGGEPRDVVPTGRPVGLHSIVENDYLMYESRDWGINLKWFKDSGKYQKWSGAIKTGKDLKKFYDEAKPIIEAAAAAGGG